MAVRVHSEKAVSADEEQQWYQKCGRKSGRLERTSAWKGQDAVEKTWKNAALQGRARAVKRGETRGKMPHHRGEPEERKSRRTWEDDRG